MKQSKYCVNYKQVAIAAAVIAVVSYVIHTLVAFLTMSYYTNPAYFLLWSDLMMPGRGPPGTDFFVYSLAFSFIAAALYAIVYSIIKESIPGGVTMKGLTFGAVLFIVAGGPSALSMYLLLAIPPALIAAWTVESFLVFLTAGLIIEKIVK